MSDIIIKTLLSLGVLVFIGPICWLVLTILGRDALKEWREKGGWTNLYPVAGIGVGCIGMAIMAAALIAMVWAG
mgnify:CR=1 FL=1